MSEMEVIGAGWGRTGTLTLKTALDILGLPCYHMKEVVDNQARGDAAKWLQAAEGEPVDFAEILSGYKACVDWPTTTFYKQLMELYPDAKVILTVRDPAKWYASAAATIWQAKKILQDAPWYARALSGLFFPGPVLGQMIDKLIWQGDLQGCFESDPERAQQLFVAWNEEVKRSVPAGKLLVFEPRQGWGPLCKFLGRPVPDQPFPHVNDTASFNKMLTFIKLRTAFFTYAVPAVGVAAVASVTAALLKRRS